MYFEKDSDARTEKKNASEMGSEKKDASQSISFADSYDHSTSEYALDYGTDVNARIPNTLKKPKFSFKKAENPDLVPLPRDTRLEPGRTSGTLLRRTTSKEPVLQALRTTPRRSEFEDSLHLKPPSGSESQ